MNNGRGARCPFGLKRMYSRSSHTNTVNCYSVHAGFSEAKLFLAKEGRNFAFCEALQRRSRTPMSEPKRILSVAYFRDLGESREVLLRTAGYQVQTVGTASEALLSLEQRRFDLVIVGHAVARADDRLIVEAAESAGKIPTLLLYKSQPHFSDKKHFNVEDGAEELLRIVAELCQTRREEA
jgi:PleD family two-component response regulator